MIRSQRFKTRSQNNLNGTFQFSFRETALNPAHTPGIPRQLPAGLRRFSQ